MASLRIFALLAAVPVVLAKPFPYPTPLANATAQFLRERGPDFEWTAWGDSYASGVGAGGTAKYVDGRRCLRYSEAYPVWMQDDPDGELQGSGGKLNNVVCSGAKVEDIEQYQFYDSDQYWGQPSWQFYPRPASGKPTMGTLTVGGDDIDFPGILSNCIVDGFPWPISTGFTARTCDQQRDLSWSLISEGGDHNTPNSNLVNSIDSLIKKIVQYGQGASGDSFRLYVTGYGQFFNADDPGCDTVTFARTANPNPDNSDTHTYLTTDLRADFNAMSVLLNAAIQQAVNNNADSNVKYIDIDSMLTGHRFCEAGVQEPDQNNPNLWFYHYPYNEPSTASDPGIMQLNQVAQDNSDALNAQWDPTSTLYVDYINAFWDLVDEDALISSVGATSETDANFYNFWPDTIGYRAQIFHPQMAYHQAIYHAIWDQYKSDTANVQTTSPPSTPSPTPTPTPTPTGPSYATGTCHIHINEWEIGCQDETSNLHAEITMWDNNGSQIGYTDPANGDNSDPANFPGINAGASLEMTSSLASILEVTGEHENDYIQFTLKSNPQLSWTSRDEQGTNPDAYCNNGGWDPRDGSYCFYDLPENAKNQVDCWFKC